ncbi:MAG: proline dehydrogenase family protein [Candidatus Dormibacteria bacterium]
MPSLNQSARAGILAAAQSRATERFMSRYGMRLGAARFVAGETLDECIGIIRDLNRQGFKCNATELGEAVESEADAARALCDYEVLLNRLAQEGLNANVAIKPTLMGLAIDEELAERNLAHLLEVARGLGMFMRMDMEESTRVDPTLRMYRRLRERGFDNVGAVLQSYLYRAVADLDSLAELRPNLRLVKGAYLESREVAYPNKDDVDRNYVRIMEAALSGGGYTAIATHDERMIDHAIGFVERHRIGRDRFEFQMLYGVRPQLQRSLVARGYTVLVATSYGTHWYPFFMRRLAERPANLLFLARNMVRR